MTVWWSNGGAIPVGKMSGAQRRALKAQRKRAAVAAASRGKANVSSIYGLEGKKKFMPRADGAYGSKSGG